jgi:hypothetical protein
MTPVDDAAAAGAIYRVAIAGAIQAATDAATRDPAYAATGAATRRAIISQDDAIYLAIQAAIRAGRGSAE